MILGIRWGHSGENQPFLHVFIFEMFSRTSGPISIKLDAYHPLVKGIQDCTIKSVDITCTLFRHDRMKIIMFCVLARVMHEF
jgi:hypothetical protein